MSKISVYVYWISRADNNKCATVGKLCVDLTDLLIYLIPNKKCTKNVRCAGHFYLALQELRKFTCIAPRCIAISHAVSSDVCLKKKRMYVSCGKNWPRNWQGFKLGRKMFTLIVSCEGKWSGTISTRCCIPAGVIAFVTFSYSRDRMLGWNPVWAKNTSADKHSSGKIIKENW